jgi:flagellar basal-body rod protein FlgG
LDVAIENKGFFALQDAEGKKFLTRAGRFKLTEDGTITAMDGKTLLGKEGPINVFQEFMEEGTANMDVRSLEIKINEKGQVYANGKEVGSIPLVKVQNEESLQRISNSEFIATNWTELEEIDESQITLRQGWLEGSNVNVVNEMIEMIELQRMYEAGSKVIKTNDDTLTNSIRLGRYY